MKKILYSILQTGGAKIYSLLLSIITLSLTTHWLGTEGRGIFVSVSTWLDLFIQVGGLSFGTVFIYQATQKRESNWLASRIASINIHITVVTILAGTFIAICYYGSIHWGLKNPFSNIPLSILLIGLIALPFGMWEIYSNSLLNIENKLSHFNRYQIIASTSNSLAVIILVVLIPLGVYGVVFAKLIWKVVAATGGLKKLISLNTHTLHYSLTHYQQLVREGLKLHLNSIGALMTTTIDIIMVNAYLGNEQTAYYQLGVQLNQMMLIVPIAAMTVLQGEITRKGYHAIWRYQTKLLTMSLGFIVATGVIAALTAQWWLIWLAGEDFYPAIKIFQYLLLFTFVATFTTLLSVQWIARGLFSTISTITLIKGVINITLNALLIPQYGLMGAVWATYAVAGFSLLVNLAMYFYCELDWQKQNNKTIVKPL